MTTPVPLRYDPSQETIADDETETIQKLQSALQEIGDTTFRNSGHGYRTVHAKSHALLVGEFEVLPLDRLELAQGLFRKPGVHPAVIRISTNPGDMLDDAISVPRGLALKVLDVEGEHLQPDGARTQDFVMVNGPAFLAPDPKAFAKNLTLLAKTTDRAPGLKKAFSALARGVEHAIEAVGGESATLKALGGHPQTNPLGESYFSQTPFLYGDYVAKFSLQPASPNLLALKDAPIDLNGDPDGIRAAMVDFFRTGEAMWEFKAQLRTDEQRMPIEDASKPWPEDASPFVTVARLRVGPQAAWTHERSSLVDDGMAFSVWQALAAHRPLGGVNRARRSTYAMSKNLRARHNACPVHEPTSVNLL